MKRFLLAFILLFVAACSTVIYTNTDYTVVKGELYENVIQPKTIIDSLIKVDTLSIREKNFKKWTSFSNFTSDSIVERTYFIYDDNCNVIISVFPGEGGTYNVKYTRGN